MLTRILIACAIALGGLGAECNPPVWTPNPPVSDAGPDANPPTCENACAVLTANGCVEAQPTPRGLTCVEVCKTTPAYAGLPVECVMGAASLDALHHCGVCR